MARKRRLLVPEAREALERLKENVVLDKSQASEDTGQALSPMSVGPATKAPASLLKTPASPTVKSVASPPKTPGPVIKSNTSMLTSLSSSVNTSGTSEAARRSDNPVRLAAKTAGVPYKDGDNGDMTARQAGKIGGNIGGPMVQRLIELAERELSKQTDNRA